MLREHTAVVTAEDRVEAAEEWRAILRRADPSHLLLVVLGSSLALAVLGEVVWMVVRYTTLPIECSTHGESD